MATGESMAEALARFQHHDGQRQLDPWQEELERLAQIERRRPLSRLVRFGEGVRCYEGWRAAEIAIVLDACAAVDGEWWIGKSRLVDKRGQVYQGHASKDGAHRMWRQNNQEAARANSRKQAAKFRERARVDWQAYRDAYLVKFVDGTSPVGFDRWCRLYRTAWLERGAASLLVNEVRGIAADIREGIEEAQGR